MTKLPQPLSASNASRSPLKWIEFVIGCLCLSGCGSTTLELQQATNPMGDNIPSLLGAEIYHNMIVKRDDYFALPAQMIVSSGSAQITNQLIFPSTTANLTGTILRSFGLQNQNQWQQTWSISAVTDPGDLQRLDALYRYATDETPRNLGEANKEPNDICSFIKMYSKAVIAAGAQAPVRLWDTVESDLYRDDYNAEKADPKKGSSDPVPRPVFGPPATLPLPPMSALKTCHSAPPGAVVTYDSLAPREWPVPFPKQDFVRIGGVYEPTPKGFVRVSELHELKQFFVRPKEFAQFELWIAGAPYNTSSGGKSSSGSSPSKGINGAGG